MDFDVNFLAVLVAAVAHQALGALWYGIIFRQAWQRAMGWTPEQMNEAGGGMDSSMALGALSSLVSAVALAVILTSFQDPDLVDGAVLGALCGIGFAAASMYMNAIYEKQAPALTAMFSAYQTVGFTLMGAILGAWR
jgi:hypothetical protein